MCQNQNGISSSFSSWDSSQKICYWVWSLTPSPRSWRPCWRQPSVRPPPPRRPPSPSAPSRPSARARTRRWSRRRSWCTRGIGTGGARVQGRTEIVRLDWPREGVCVMYVNIWWPNRIFHRKLKYVLYVVWEDSHLTSVKPMYLCLYVTESVTDSDSTNS